MKLNGIILFEMLMAALLAASCEKRIGGENSVEITVSCELGKGVLLGTDEISNLNVFAYRDSLLYAQKYSESTSLDIELQCGCTYTFYVLANMGEVNAPASESNLKSLRCQYSSVLVGGPIPMVSKKAVSATALDGGTISIEVERLMSICRLVIVKKFNKCDFVFKGAKLLQAPLDVCPFAEESAATKTGDGDYVSSADIISVNNGGSADFMMLENCQGVLLPGNTSQWKKTPESIREKKDLCTYMEVDGRFIKNGLSATVVYRMYLGRDNCTDFNVSRNTVNQLTLTLTDDGIMRDSWQVEYYGI